MVAIAKAGSGGLIGNTKTIVVAIEAQIDAIGASITVDIVARVRARISLVVTVPPGATPCAERIAVDIDARIPAIENAIAVDIRQATWHKKSLYR